ncbi:WavE lipopolysaccharide synthesis family protein [Gemmata sp.]|uniref:WavE lipopolysaccharide synthesis family protein n=1 Tax=Gemmata sp. TaxID=1914242 RepID=UPI003F6F2FCF
MTVLPSEISVVVQGPVDRALTPRCLASVRKHLPGAEVVLSTWKGTDLAGLDYDRAVENDDPGAVVCTRSEPKVYFNVNRQIVSTVNGLRAATRPYAVKVRADMEFTGTGFLDLFDRYPARAAEWRVFERRVVTCTLPSQSVRRRGLSYSPSDWFHFGLTADVLTLWDVPLDVGNGVGLHFANRPRPSPDRMPDFVYQFIPEQYIWINCLRKFGPLEVAHLGDRRPGHSRLSELTFANNFIMADERILGVWFRKYPFHPSSRCGYMFHDEWKMLYREYCDPKFCGVNRRRYWTEHVKRVGELMWFRGRSRLLAWVERRERP